MAYKPTETIHARYNYTKLDSVLLRCLLYRVSLSPHNSVQPMTSVHSVGVFLSYCKSVFVIQASQIRIHRSGRYLNIGNSKAGLQFSSIVKIQADSLALS